MRPRLFTPRKFILFLLAGTIFAGLSIWIARGMPLPGAGVPSTAGKIAFVSNRAGNPDIYLMNGDGSEPVAITSGPVAEDQPTWSPSGSELTFIGAKSTTDSPQVYMADAMVGRNAVLLSKTSGAKSYPRWASDQEVYFLDAGKLNSYNLQGQDSHAVFPESDHKRLLADLLSGGGLEVAYEIAEHRYVLVLNTEQGQALMLYQFNHDAPDSLVLAALGSGEKIHVSPLTGGGFAAAFENGAPLQEPVMILNPQVAQQMEAAGLTPQAPPLAVQEGSHVVALFSGDGVAQSALPLPVAARELVTSPDGKSLLLAPRPDPKNADIVGLLLLTPAEEKVTQLTSLPASQPSISPDGTQVAFVSGNDIYVVSTQGGEPKNLTQGKGKNSAPVWSPTLAVAKK